MGVITNSMDSVFNSSLNDELEFDTIFDQDDSIIDTVNGVNEAGEPLTGVEFDELHQTDDDGVMPDDLEDELEGDEYTFGNNNAENTKKRPLTTGASVGSKTASCADKVLADIENVYQDTDFDTSIDQRSVTKNINKAIGEADDMTDDELDDVNGSDSQQECGSKCTKESTDGIDAKLDTDDVDEELDTDSVDDELDNDDMDDITEAADSDVTDVVDDELDSDDDIDDIDSVSSGNADLSYDYSDEDLIDSVINGD